MKKQVILDTVKDLPKEVDLENFFEMLLVRDKIEKGLEDIENGRTVAHEKVVKYFQKKWSKFELNT